MQLESRCLNFQVDPAARKKFCRLPGSGISYRLCNRHTTLDDDDAICLMIVLKYYEARNLRFEKSIAICLLFNYLKR